MKYFKIEEFQCPCCGKAEMDTEFLDLLDKARHLANIPFKINSGYRCRLHNKAVGGKDTSAHLGGFAADIDCQNSRSRCKMLASLISVGFNRIGIAKTFIHVDIDSTKDSNVVWLY